MFTPKIVSGGVNCLIVDGVVTIGNGINILGAMEVDAKVWNCRLPGESVRTTLRQNFWWRPSKRQILVEENCGFDL